MDEETYPKRTPPKATNNPIRIAGAAEPGTPGGGLSIRPMVRRVRVLEEGCGERSGGGEAGGVDEVHTAVKMRP